MKHSPSVYAKAVALTAARAALLVVWTLTTGATLAQAKLLCGMVDRWQRPGAPTWPGRNWLFAALWLTGSRAVAVQVRVVGLPLAGLLGISDA